ncbi:uncharacterized protein KGF55_003537 [Candida pseudojiufengensis]|uniref:uncharacterized protein n=1 Tax=Candida pseudojiufengensis TaxID=497109 RepID=UPI002224A96D|nr:uncharacterized protein KGF55_003537 [Candida pseudojiufengensis]KAI5962461.1 hypothetical protein KGF55_003537 [Candida pseudojiufengensis]
MRYGSYGRSYGGGFGSSYGSSYGSYGSSSYNNRRSSQYYSPVTTNTKGTQYGSNYYDRNRRSSQYNQNQPQSKQNQPQYKQDQPKYQQNQPKYNQGNSNNPQYNSRYKYQKNKTTNVNQNVNVNNQGNRGFGRMGGFMKWPFMMMLFSRMGRRHQVEEQPPPIVNVYNPPPEQAQNMQPEQIQDMQHQGQVKKRTLISKNAQYEKDVSPISETSERQDYETDTFGKYGSDNDLGEVDSPSSFRGNHLVSNLSNEEDDNKLLKPKSQQTIDMQHLLQSTPPVNFNQQLNNEYQSSFQP